jgi:hypothetical protein
LLSDFGVNSSPFWGSFFITVWDEDSWFWNVPGAVSFGYSTPLTSYASIRPNAFFSRPGRAEITFGSRTNFGASESYFTGRIPRVGLQKLVGRINLFKNPFSLR